MQAWFRAQGVEGLTRDKTRKPGKQPLRRGTVRRLVDLAFGPPSGEAIHSTSRMFFECGWSEPRFSATYRRGSPTRAAPHPHDATHKHPEVRQWLTRHACWMLHFTPSLAFSLNAIEASSPSSRASAPSAVYSDLSLICRLPPTASLRRRTLIRSLAYGRVDHRRC